MISRVDRKAAGRNSIDNRLLRFSGSYDADLVAFEFESMIKICSEIFTKGFFKIFFSVCQSVRTYDRFSFGQSARSERAR